MTPTAGDGLDRLRVFASTGESPAFPPGAAEGRFAVYTGPEGEQLAEVVRRGVVKKPGVTNPTGDVAEAEIRFRVQK